MKETTKKTIKTIAKVIAIMYMIEIVAAAVMVAVNTVMVGWESTKRIIKNSLVHTCEFYKKLFRGRFKEAVAECTDAELDGAYINIQSSCGDEAAAGFMEGMYDALAGVIPFSRNRCPADKKKPVVGGLNTILKRVVKSEEYPDDVPEDILRAAGDID